VQNTRRWATQATSLRGQALNEGDAVLLLLASANHDEHEDAQAGWGAGRHACPGRRLSVRIAAALLAEWQRDDAVLLRARSSRWRYRRSPNARIPLFTAGARA
jgi:cytochrome P450